MFETYRYLQETDKKSKLVSLDSNVAPQVIVLRTGSEGDSAFEFVNAREDSQGRALREEPKPMTLEDYKQQFKTLLVRHLVNNTNQKSANSLRCQLRREFVETGCIPAVLLGQETRGRKTTLGYEIQRRFLQLVKNSVDPLHPEFHTQKLRKVTVFKETLAHEFKCEIPVHKLYQIIDNTQGLRALMERVDDETAEQKVPSFFAKEEVGALVQMDGVTSDYFEIRIDERWVKPVFIELFDRGSRMLLARRAYKSEDSFSGVDVFCRFLSANPFANKAMPLQGTVKPRSVVDRELEKALQIKFETAADLLMRVIKETCGMVEASLITSELLKKGLSFEVLQGLLVSEKEKYQGLCSRVNGVLAFNLFLGDAKRLVSVDVGIKYERGA